MIDKDIQVRLEGIVYLDNGATSFPKPPQVGEAMLRWLREVGGSPGRSGHRQSTESARAVFEARESLAKLLGAPSSKQIIFAQNATMALNTAIFGLLSPGDHVVTTSMEHNSVMRPLRHLEKEGIIKLTVVQCRPDGKLDPTDISRAINAHTAMVITTHASNITGTIMPLAELGQICRDKKSVFLVDAAQSAGILPIDVTSIGIDLLAFTGHKGLLGPMGTGGLYVAEDLEVKPLVRGGTGSDSEFEEQPDFLPDRLESGTPNAIGLAGLGASVDFILSTGVEEIRKEEQLLSERLIDGLKNIPGVTLFGPSRSEERTAVVSFTIDGLTPSEIGYILDEAFGIMVRVGLHCAPSAHRTTGTFPEGTVRMVPGFFNTVDDIDYTIDCLKTISSKKRQ